MKLGEELEMRVWEQGKQIADDFGVLNEYLELKRKVEREKDKEWKKYVKYVKSRGGDNPMTERIKEERISGIGVGGAPRKGKPKTKKKRKEEHIKRYGSEELPPRGTGLENHKLINEEMIMLDLERGETILGGIVINEEKALATPCHGYDLGEGKKMLWSEGVIGGLSLPEQEKYCRKGLDLKPMTGALAKRITALREAGIRFK